MSNVYYKKINNETSVEEIQAITKQLLDKLISEEKIELSKAIPLKVHFGEEGNVTFIKPENYNGIIDFLKERKISSCFIETTVLYKGNRHNRESHVKLAKEHGFTNLPIAIADGENGEGFVEVGIDQKNFATCKIGKDFTKFDQLIVISHFKGHALAGFGGAIKQLAMGCASKGGKLAMHMGIKPKIIERKCKKCHMCDQKCIAKAITITDDKSFIDHEKCVGCGACVAICPNKAISIYTIKGMLRFIGIGNPFKENLAEYALAAQKGKRNIYINFAKNITKGCDCEGKVMQPIMGDFGIFISTDPVAIDRACFDMAKERGVKFRGEDIFEYAQSIGLGLQDYDLIELY